VEVRRGAEVKLDLPEPDLSDPRFRLGGGTFVLVEFPYFTVPPRSSRVMAHLRSQGWTPIVAHPERYGGMLSGLDVLEEWRSAGADLQVNGPSLIGRYGEEARIAAFRILENGWADYLSSDYHAHGRPDITAYREALRSIGGEEQMLLLTEMNPRRMLDDQTPLPVAPLALKRSLWDRISGTFRG
ncbi:MAG: CpsB/CapC family capsule biosynthesis tyrosine phosphatase, partial [Longimicrobiales bacterium]